jgi:hypothetical protein
VFLAAPAGWFNPWRQMVVAYLIDQVRDRLAPS